MQPTQAFRNSSTQRSAFFNQLKPCCVELAKTLRKSEPSAGPRDAAATAVTLIGLTETLYGLLAAQVAHDASVLDAALADYVFFPLLPVFQNLRAYPARLVENGTKCLRLLIEHGWKTALPQESAQRFLILLTQVVTGGRLPSGRSEAKAPPAGPEGEPLPEETVAEGYRALTALLRTAGASPSGQPSPLVATNVVPALAHTVTVLLEGVTESVVPAVQLEALGAIAALYASLRDQEALAAFLPGTVSSLARLYTLQGAHKMPKRVVVRALEVLQTVLVNTLGDIHTRRLHAQIAAKKTDVPPTAETAQKDGSPSTANPIKAKLDVAWLTATASQVKVALSSVLKLRNHESEDVRDAVQQFCVSLLDECHASLAECTALLVESAIVTTRVGQDRPADAFALGAASGSASGFGQQTTLLDLAILYPELADAVKSTAYDWATGLPRAMQSSDEDAKKRALRNLQSAIGILEELHVDSTTLQSTLAAALRDSVVTLVRSASPAQRAVVNEAADTEVSLLQTGAEGGGGDASLSTSRGQTQYAPIILSLGSQRGTRAAVLDLIAKVGSPAQQAQLASEMLDVVRDADGLDQVAAFWLAFELVKASFGKTDELDSFLNLDALDSRGGSGPGSETEAVFEELVAFSVSVLAAHSDTADESDWRVGALSLEVTAFAAARLGAAFRPELIDVLYPVATYLGSPEPQLRAHAVATLNGLAVACGYGSVSELIVANVDYMLNSVSLRLNTFDISPASTKVLTMMIRLAGPRLVPYLDDVVAALFAALDNYHGYPLFVENLFSVLGEVVQQTVQSPALLIEDAPSKSKRGGQSESGAARNRKRPLESPSTDDLVELLRRRAKRRKDDVDAEDEDDEDEIHRGLPAGERHPKRPWTSEASALLRKHEKQARGKGEGVEADDSDDDSAGEKPDLDKEGGPGQPGDAKTPTYALLARITTLTQHYLTAPTPTLRKALLDLLATLAPALAHDENAFLPLVNAVWPVVVARLYDGEPYVAAAACQALAALCAAAGDFLATRVKDEWHARLGRWCARAKAAAAAKVTAGSGGGGGSSLLPSSGSGTSGLKLPSVTHIHQRATAWRTLKNRTPAGPAVPTQAEEIVVPFRSSAPADGRANGANGANEPGNQIVEVSSSRPAAASEGGEQQDAAVSTGGGPAARVPRPSVIHIHQRATALRTLKNTTPAAADGPGDQLVEVSSSVRPAAATSGGGEQPAAVYTGGSLGRFAQAAQAWEAAAGLLIAVVQYVRLDDDVFDAVLDLLLEPVPVPGQQQQQPQQQQQQLTARPLLPPAEEQKAREALSVVNADAVWLAQYRYSRAYSVRAGAGNAAWKPPPRTPVLPGVSFSVL